MNQIPVITAEQIMAAVSRVDAVAAIEQTLRAGQDVEADTPRLFRSLAAGEFLLMPAESPDYAGVKVATVAPGNSAIGLPKIHAWYLLFHADTLLPAAIMEGTFLTILRTPAVTTAAIRALLAAAPTGPVDRIERLAVLGSGPQAEAHVRTLVETIPTARVELIGRTPERVASAVERLMADGVPAVASDRSALPEADVIVTATSSSEPVLDLDSVAPDAVVAAIGAHGTQHRELGSALITAADLVVEARASAFRESGNLLAARTVEEWKTGSQPVTNLRELVAHGMTRRAGHPAVYTGVGMSWEDLAIAEKVLPLLGGAAAPSHGRKTDGTR